MVCRSSIVDLSSHQISTGTVASANIFIFSWGSFIVSIALGCAWFEASLEMTDYVLLGVFGASLSASSMLFYREEIIIETEESSAQGKVCEILADFDCTRVKFGQFLGIATVLIAIIVVSFQRKLVTKLRLVVGLVLFVAYSCAAGYMTFGRGHGSIAGSVYLEVWAAFFLSMDIMNTNIVSMLHSYYGDEPENEGSHHHEVEPNQADQEQAVEERKDQNVTTKRDSSDESHGDEDPDSGEDAMTLPSSL